MNPPPDAPMLPPNLPPLPPVPDGYDRWEYRGTAWKASNVVFASFAPSINKAWSMPLYKHFQVRTAGGFKNEHYIEAVKDSPALPDGCKMKRKSRYASDLTCDACGLGEGHCCEEYDAKPAVPAQGGEKDGISKTLHEAMRKEVDRYEPPAADSLRDTPRTDAFELANRDSGMNLWVDALNFARTLERELAEANAKLSEMEDCQCAMCGGPMSRNPHPDAGKPEHLMKRGAMWECIPCLQKGVHSCTEKLRAAKQDSERLEWQPIETAPRDGTEILAKLKGRKTPQPIRWKARSYWQHLYDMEIIMETNAPTHWQPLPDAPGDSNQQTNL